MMGNLFNPDFKDFIETLNLFRVDYLLVGGYAVIIYGYYRTTGDLDIWVNPTKENYKKLSMAFAKFGLPIDAIGEDQFIDPIQADVFSFGRPPVSIDILTQVKGINFEESFAVSNMDDSQGFKINVINYQHLINAKKAAGRFKDLNDIENLENQ